MRATIGFDSDQLDWDKTEGMIPAVVQDNDTLEVLMLGYMTREALDRTIESGLVTFYSRSRQTLWTKGETSGNVLNLISIHADCDRDTLLILAAPSGPTCHRGTRTCFDPEDSAPEILRITELERIIGARLESGNDTSYTRQLLESGVERVAQKVGEEAVETVIAALSENDESFLDETADLVYHLLVLLRSRGLQLSQVEAVLRKRHQSN